MDNLVVQVVVARERPAPARVVRLLLVKEVMAAQGLPRLLILEAVVVVQLLLVVYQQLTDLIMVLAATEQHLHSVDRL